LAASSTRCAVSSRPTSCREPEIDALVGAVSELGRLTAHPPHIEAVSALVKLLGRTMQEEKVDIRARPFLG
jgi:2-dehydropantoate 2-reductase